MKTILTKCFKYIILLLFMVISLTPFLWLLSSSFKGSEEIFSFPPKLFPNHFNFENYIGAWSSVPFGSYFINSIIVVVFTLILNLLLSTLAGYALARFEFKGKSILFIFVLASMLIPREIILIPVYMNVLKLGISDTLAGVFLPFAVEGFSIFLMRQAFLSIPKELEEAAILDGCNYFDLYRKILIPMVKPSIATLALFTFIGSWGDFLWPMIVLKSPENYTLQVGLSFMTGTFVNNFRFVAAGTVLSTIPVIIVFLFNQKYFKSGIFAGLGK